MIASVYAQTMTEIQDIFNSARCKSAQIISGTVKHQGSKYLGFKVCNVNTAVMKERVENIISHYPIIDKVKESKSILTYIFLNYKCEEGEENEK